MKNVSLFILALVLFSSCSKSENDNNTICDSELNCIDEFCLFTLDNEQGTTTFLNCYGAWSIHIPNEDEGGAWYMVDEWSDDYKVEGREVTFCGYVRENTLPLLLPDPMPGRFYQIELENIEISED